MEEPFLYFQGGPDTSIVIPVKGVTQDGQEVRITNPAAHGVEFKTPSAGTGYRDYRVDEDGKYTVGEGEVPGERENRIPFAGEVHISLADSYFVVRLFHPTASFENFDLDEWEIMSYEREAIAIECLVMDNSGFSLHRQWIHLSNTEALPAVEQAVLKTGYRPVQLVEERLYRQEYDIRPELEIDFYPLAVVYEKESCPTSQEWQLANKTWSKVPGVQEIPLADAYDEFLNYVAYD